jgi:hypothetical protein
VEEDDAVLGVSSSPVVVPTSVKETDVVALAMDLRMTLVIDFNLANPANSLR